MTASHPAPSPTSAGSVLDGDPRILIPLPEAAERRSRSPAVNCADFNSRRAAFWVGLQLVRRGIAKPTAPARRSTPPADLLLPIPWRSTGNLAIEQR